MQDVAHDPLDGKEYPTIHRSLLSPFRLRQFSHRDSYRYGVTHSITYTVLEPKMCENCDANFLRTIGSPVKYCGRCQ